MSRHFTVTLSAPGQEPGFIWVCNWCGEEATTPATLHSDLVAGVVAHLGTCWPYLRHQIGRASDTWGLHRPERREPWEITPR